MGIALKLLALFIIAIFTHFGANYIFPVTAIPNFLEFSYYSSYSGTIILKRPARNHPFPPWLSAGITQL